MNIVRIPRLLKNSTFLLTILGSSLLLSACGGGGGSKSSTTSSTSSSSSSHAFSSTPVTTPGSGIWPDVKVSANGTKTLKFDWSAVNGATYYKLLKKADSTSSYVQVGSDFSANTTVDPVSVHLTDWVNSRYKVQACNNSGCQDSNVIAADSAMIAAITQVKASNAEAGDWFGWSVTISGDGKTMAVGATAESSNATGVNGNQASNTSPTSGAVYVFAKVNGNWQQEAYLKASNTEQPGDGVTAPIPNPNARFGYQVALSTDGNTLAVSAINEDSASISANCEPHNINYSSSASNSQGYEIHTSNTDVGAVYVFKRSGTQWTQQAYIKPIFGYNVGATNLEFGSSLALSGDGKTLVVGTQSDSLYVGGVVFTGADKSSAGFTCINFSTSSSSSTSSLSSSSSSTTSSSSSSSTSSSSSSVLGGPNSGAIYIYKLDGDKWIEDAMLKASDAGAGDNFGASIALSHDGNLMAVGASGEDSKTSAATDDVITLDSVNYPLDNGGVYIFVRNSDTAKWTEQTKLKPNYIQWRQEFGASLAFSADGTTLAVGSPGDWTATGGINPDGSVYDPKTYATTYASGAAYIFTKTNTTWAQQAYVKAAVPHAGNQFGSAVSLSADGNILAVGSWIESSQATGINGDQQDTGAVNSGAAYIFTRAGTSWTQKSYVKAPDTKAQDRFGRSLMLDDSGENLLIGAHRKSIKSVGSDSAEVNNPEAGAVYIY